jgi:hypothetical protein
MRIAICCTVLTVALAASGQTMSPCSTNSDSFLAGSPVAYIPQSAPLAYTVTIRATWEQKLADGNRVLQTADITEARDGKGRIVRIEPTGCDTDAHGQPQIKVRVTKYDPVAHTRSFWNTGPGALGLATVDSTTLTPTTDLSTVPRTAQPPVTSHATVRHEDLGPRTIAGVVVNGARTIKTIPPGSEGNESPIEVVRDEWTEPGSRLLLLVNNVDPRHGTASWETTSFALGEPDPRLFDPPTNYKVRSITSTQAMQ